MWLRCKCVSCKNDKWFKSGKEHPRYEAQREGWRVRGRGWICPFCREKEREALGGVD
jgi:hypothetical protein